MFANFPFVSDIATPLLGFRFSATFLSRTGVEHPLDIRFQSVSGPSVQVEVARMGNHGRTRLVLPERLDYPNLVLKRGMPRSSSLRTAINDSISAFQFTPTNVLLSVLDEQGIPSNSWILEEVIVVGWGLSGLDASTSGVIIEEMELAYQRYKPFSL